MILHEIGIGNYKSIGYEPIWINLEKKVNIFIGTNNCGKSNILKAFRWISNNKQLNQKLGLLEFHQRDENNPIRLSFKASLESHDIDHPNIESKFILDVEIFPDRFNWLSGPLPNINNNNDLHKYNEYMKKYEGHYFSGIPNEQSLKNTSDKIYQNIAKTLISLIPKTFVIPQFRQIIPGSDYEIAGKGIVELLSSWQHPEINKDTLFNKFIKIQILLQRLLELPGIELEVVHTNDKIVVKNGNLRLPLESHGTSIHELIILAIAVFSEENSFFLIEEPEIHLHPKLQKEFLNFLINETNNQYLITTHSNALIAPSQEVDITHLQLTNGITNGRRVISEENVLDILNDLGIKPSDILQANSIIWVEGPSDRIYLNKWIQLLYPNIIEGIDYSIMFYGGKLLSHLSLNREKTPNPDDLIPLLKINQHSAIIIDSDRKIRGDRLSHTKLRIRKECKENNIFCWITDGREIENYISIDSITSTYNELTQSDIKLSFGQFDELEKKLKSSLKSKWREKFSYNKAKPTISRKICSFITINDIDANVKKNLSQIYKLTIIKN